MASQALTGVHRIRGSAVPVVEDHFARSIGAAARFFDAHAAEVARACQLVAARFERGGTLLVFGEGAQASDAAHVAVEFVHPIVVGKRALPARALTGGAAAATGAVGNAEQGPLAPMLRAIAQPPDVAMGLCAGDVPASIRAALDEAGGLGALPILFCGGTRAGGALPAGVTFAVPEADPLLVQEVHETLYHVLWELVHVFLECGDRTAAAADAGSRAEAGLYPFLFGSGAVEPALARRLLEEVEASTRLKSQDICALRREVASTSAATIAAAGRAIAERVRRGARLLVFGNGGSATDALDAAADALLPARPGWRAIPALALPDDVGVVTAVANDVGFEHVFVRQVATFGRQVDVALGISTSGNSRNVVRALAEARTRGLLTVALSGGDGGEMARPGAADICISVPCDYVPRIQEAHASIWHALLAAVHAELGGGAPAEDA